VLLAGCLHSGDVLGQARRWRVGGGYPVDATGYPCVSPVLRQANTSRAHSNLGPCPLRASASDATPRYDSQIPVAAPPCPQHLSQRNLGSCPSMGDSRDPPAMTDRNSPDRVPRASHLTRITIRSFARRYYDSSALSAKTYSTNFLRQQYQFLRIAWSLSRAPPATADQVAANQL
jgi:hypothetical protein